MIKIPSPTKFEKIAAPLAMVALPLSLIALVVGGWLAFKVAPPDYLQGESVRIMHIHVPSAWLGIALYGVLAVASGMYLYKGSVLALALARAVAPLGAFATALTMLSGGLWGRLTWGTYWVWDARLTSVAVLLFFYLGYFALADAFEDRVKGRKLASVAAVFGAINLPIIKFSVDWWNTLHQSATLSRFGSPKIDTEMLTPLLVMALSIFLFALWFVLTSMRAILAETTVKKGNKK